MKHILPKVSSISSMVLSSPRLRGFPNQNDSGKPPLNCRTAQALEISTRTSWGSTTDLLRTDGCLIEAIHVVSEEPPPVRLLVGAGVEGVDGVFWPHVCTLYLYLAQYSSYSVGFIHKNQANQANQGIVKLQRYR